MDRPPRVRNLNLFAGLKGADLVGHAVMLGIGFDHKFDLRRILGHHGGKGTRLVAPAVTHQRQVHGLTGLDVEIFGTGEHQMTGVMRDFFVLFQCQDRTHNSQFLS